MSIVTTFCSCKVSPYSCSPLSLGSSYRDRSLHVFFSFTPYIVFSFSLFRSRSLSIHLSLCSTSLSLSAICPHSTVCGGGGRETGDGREKLFSRNRRLLTRGAPLLYPNGNSCCLYPLDQMFCLLLAPREPMLNSLGG